MNELKQGTPLQGGKYIIKKVLGQGGFGITYLAEQVSLGREVAIKEFFMNGINDRKGNAVQVSNLINQPSYEEQKRKFLKEAKRISALNNEHIIKVHDLFEENNTAYYVMDYIEGSSLADKLKQDGVFQEVQVEKYFKQLLSALEVMHKAKMWHLDIKPANILLNKGNVVLIDFGASKQTIDDSLTLHSAVAYTMGFAPPEQMQSQTSNFGPYTDFYALGASLYMLLTGNFPPSFSNILSEGASAFLFPHSISEKMKAIIFKMMRPNKNERPSNVQEVRKMLLKDGLSIHVDYPITNEQLRGKAEEYYNQHAIEILNKNGFFELKKKKQAQAVWASAIICMVLAILAVAIYISSIGGDLSGIGAIIMYILAAFVGLIPGLYIGPAIAGSRIESQCNKLADEIKQNFILQYMREHK